MEERLNVAVSTADDLRRRVTSCARKYCVIGVNRAVQERLAALGEDLQAHLDIATLRRLGSSELQRIHGDCPVCHQALPESLLGFDADVRTLSLDDTIGYIRQRVELFSAMERDTERVLKAKNERLAALRNKAADVRAEMRALRMTLSQDKNAPSAAVIADRIRLQDRIDRFRGVAERFAALQAELERLASEALQVRLDLEELPDDGVSQQDREKLSLLQTFFVRQLHDYGFGSFSDEQLSISREDYLPMRDQFDLQADISASDSIRVVWAYLLGLMEVAAIAKTNHPGLLIFDEPRQQSANRVSFGSLITRASLDSSDRQVIFATSEEEDSLLALLEGRPHSLYAVDGYLLKSVDRSLPASR